MLESGIFKNLLFVDIETVSLTKKYGQLSSRMQNAWEHKSKFINREELSIEDLYFEKAGIYSEFGKIIVISVGFIYLEKGILKAKIKTLQNHNEKQLLKDFLSIINTYNQDNLILCAHNGKEFDFPYLSRRLLINKIPLPNSLKLSGKKPWEVNHLDTLEMWKFGDRKHFTSLELICTVLGIESSKSYLDGSKVNGSYYNDDGLDDISVYCSLDVFNLMCVYLVFNELGILDKKDVIFIE